MPSITELRKNIAINLSNRLGSQNKQEPEEEGVKAHVVLTSGGQIGNTKSDVAAELRALQEAAHDEEYLNFPPGLAEQHALLEAALADPTGIGRQIVIEGAKRAFLDPDGNIKKLPPWLEQNKLVIDMVQAINASAEEETRKMKQETSRRKRNRLSSFLGKVFSLRIEGWSED